MNREREMLLQFTEGKIPAFYRRFCPVSVTNVAHGKTNFATFYTAPDYLALGSDEDYFLAPMTPVTAQRLADRLDCTLPTCKMVNDIYAAAAVKLPPAPLPPGPQMTTVPVFAQHNAIVRTQRLAQLAAQPLGALVGGHKKDVVITARLNKSPGKVAIYGWHQTNGLTIQPLYLGHTATWVDYSHGVRLVQNRMLVNGEPKSVAEVLADPTLASLLSDEGVVTTRRYATETFRALPANTNSALPKALAGLQPSSHFGEQTMNLTFEPDVKIHVNASAAESAAADKPIMLIFYALPNGNTTEQTIGHKPKPGDDWHFDIQHIGAQARFLRGLLPNRTGIVVYLEAAMKSWSAWRKQHGNERIPQIVAVVKNLFTNNQVEVVLTGHSGGGSFAFGYLSGVEAIPDDVSRIAFLDSNYAYETTNHLTKLAGWLKSSPHSALCVLAYHDSIALLEGRTFVSERGGTWGRSHAMLADLGTQFQFTARTNCGLRVHNALNGRIQFLLMENPDRKILHTVQVERNGFLHAMLTGTPLEGHGYEYLGERAYTQWIQAEP